MLKKLFLKVDRSFLLLLYFSVMPSVLGTALASYCLFQAEEVRQMTFVVLIVVNIIFSLILALGFMPTTFYSLVGGYILGWQSVPYLFSSYLIASGIGYFVCLKLDNGTLVSILNQRFKLSDAMEKLSSSGILLASFCRLSPTLPFAVLNAIFALVRFPFVPYILGSAIGMVPRTVFAVYLGSRFTHVSSFEDLKEETSLWFALALAIISFAGIGWIIKRKFF